MRKIILDVDTGVDDAIAIITAITSPNIEVLAITCVKGNTSIENSSRNTARILQYFQKQIPIYKGASRSILGTNILSECRFEVHGRDGMGDADWSEDVDTSQIKSEHAVNALIRIAKQHSGEVSLVALGPLTNVALALNLEPELSQHLKDIHIMGGNTNGSGPDVIKEFNFGVDPEAAFITLDYMKGRATLQTRDVTDNTVFSKEWFSEALKVETRKSNFISKITQYRFEGNRFPYIRLPDFLLMAAFCHPETVTESVRAHATVNLEGESRGLLDIDLEIDDPNVTVYMEESIEGMQQYFKKMLQD